MPVFGHSLGIGALITWVILSCSQCGLDLDTRHETNLPDLAAQTVIRPPYVKAMERSHIEIHPS